MADKAPIAGQKIKRKFMGNFIDSAFQAQRKRMACVLEKIWKNTT